ncbi:MAG: FadR family transcriptional regulator [Verrucomicrobiaceae bacterium]|nr:FadR family transcriptional regulator [Verrucomicrobiaceae bacterium]
MKLAPVRPTNNLVEEVCLQLSSRIRLEMAGGDGWLPPERALAAQLGVSRPVVREATKRLELQGMLEIRHGSGIKMINRLHAPLNKAVTLLLPDEVERLRQLTETRLILEPTLARLAAAQMKAKDRKHLRAVHERLVAAETSDEAIPADMDFHRAIAQFSGNGILHLLVDSMADLHRTSLARGYERVSTDNAVAQHERILVALEARDGTTAASAMHEHLVTAWHDLGLRGSPAPLGSHLP